MTKKRQWQSMIPLNEKNFELMLWLTLGTIILLLAYTLSIQRIPQEYTEAMFSGELPKEAIQGKTVDFSYTILNHEGKDLEYDIIVYSGIPVKDQNLSKRIGVEQAIIHSSKKTMIRNTEKKAFSEKITLQASTEKQQVVVALKNPEMEQYYEIHFWVNVKSS